MHQHRTLNLMAILVMVFLAACSPVAQPAAPSRQPQAEPASAAASAGQPNDQALSPAADAPTAAPTDAPAPAPTPTRPPLPPTVVSVRPDRGEEQIIAAPVIITFDQPMDPASTSTAFSIQPDVPGDITVKGSQLTFTPTERLERGLEYRITVAASAKSAGGLQLQQPVSYKFKTVGFLQVTNTQPANETEGVPVDTPIVIAFNRPVVPLTAAGEQAGLPAPLIITPTLEGVGEWINTSIYRFTPLAGLAAATAYSVTVKADLEDTTGGVLGTPHTFIFRTGEPAVLRWNPEASRNVRIERPISVTFSMPMDRPSTEAAFSLTDASGETVEGAFSWSADGTELGFKPTQVLKFGARYVAEVATSARASAGIGTLRDSASRSFAFQTAPLPKVTGTEPKAGEAKHPPASGVRFEFAGPINPASLISGTITILPKPTQVYTYYNDSENYLYLDFPKLPATDYTVTLSGKVADPYGNTLGKDSVLRFRTGDLEPIIRLNNQGQVGTYSAYTETQAVVIYRNTPEVRFDLYRVTTDEFIAVTGREYWEAWEKYRPAAEARVREWAVASTVAANTAGFLREPLVDSGGAALAPGIYWLELGGVLPQGQRPPRQLIIRTDLNVTLKASHDTALAWVTDLKTGLPVPGAQVRFTDNARNDIALTADKDGVAAVKLAAPREPWEPLVALASTEAGGFGVASTLWADGISSWDFGLPGGAQAESYTGYVYTDRPIYRPGQTMYWKAIVRRVDDAIYSLPAPSQPVTVTIYDDQGNNLLESSQTLNALGATDGLLALGPDATLGYYYISVQLAENASTGVGFQVAEYRKPEYELSAQTDKPEYIQGEQINVTMQADYFFGGPVKKGKVRWTLLTNDAFFDFQGEGYYSFNDWEWWNVTRSGPAGGQLSQGEGRTDDQGRFTFSLPADIARFQDSQRFTIDITVQDLNNQAVSTQAYAVVHKGQFYIGLSPRGYVAAVGDRSEVDIITVDAQSAAAPGVEVTAVVNKIEWKSVREKAEDGRFYWVTRPVKTAVLTETLITDAQGAALLAWTPADSGEYKVEARARDKAGHTLRSAAYVWVSGRDFVPWRQENNDRIKLVADKDEYRVGDVAEILAPSPYQGKVKALLTIERGRVLSHQVIELDGNSEILRVPITAAMSPNAFVSLVIMKGTDATSPAPSFKVGLIQLKVSVAEKQLQVIATPRGDDGAGGGITPPQFAPRDTVTWDIQTLDAAGKPVPAEVSLALVDKAVLSLAADTAGALLDRFYSQRALGVQTGTTLALNIDRLVAQLAEEGKGGGGGGDGPGMTEVRREFPDVAFWRAAVTTGADGKASVEVTLPDNLTTWTMDARAASADTLVGQSKTDIIATKPLLVRPVLPRFFVAGDKAEIAGIIHNTTAEPLEVTVRLAATGLDLPDATTATVDVPAGGTYKATWPIAVQADAEQIVVSMTASAAAATSLVDAVEVTLPVHRYSTPEVVGTSGQVGPDGDVLELVRLPAGIGDASIDPTRAELDVTLEPSLAAGMLGGLAYLEHYPYECVEQTLSRFLPNVVSYAALKRLGRSNPDLETKLPQQVGVGLQRIYSKQHVDGGWGWWTNDDSNVTISAYVVFGLAKAKQAGFTVDQGVLNRGIKFLQSSLKAPKDLREWQLDRQAFILYALAEAGQLEPNRAGALFAENAKLAAFGKAYLALALGLIDDAAAPDRIKTLLVDLGHEAEITATSAHWEEGLPDYWNMNTDTRSTAIVLAALAQLDPENALGPNTVRWLMTARKAAHWETTQETAWAIIALTEWMAATGELEGDYNWQVALNGQPLGEGAVTPETIDQAAVLRADITQLLLDQTNDLVLSRAEAAGQTGEGRLYYTVHLKTYQPAEQIQPLSRGLTVSREVRLADCLTAQEQAGAKNPAAACPPVDKARVGDVLQIKLTLIVPNTSHYVVVEDPLPAGLEGVDASLLTTSSTAEGPGMEKQSSSLASPWYDWWWTPTHVELRDEKAVLFATDLAPGTYEFTYQARASLPGAFLTLPPTASQMYFPEVWGRGAGGVFTVTE